MAEHEPHRDRRSLLVKVIVEIKRLRAGTPAEAELRGALAESQRMVAETVERAIKAETELRLEKEALAKARTLYRKLRDEKQKLESRLQSTDESEAA